MSLSILHRRRLAQKFVPGEPNTFIGGMGSVITNETQLANRLEGLEANDIYKFSISNNNISCYIHKEYNIVGSTFGEEELTYYHDLGGKCLKLLRRSFRYAENLQCLIFPKVNEVIEESILGCSSLRELWLPELLNWSGYDYTGLRYLQNLERFIAPKLTNISSTNENTFQNCPAIKRVYIPRCTNFGNTHGKEGSTFNSMPAGGTIYADPFMETANGGDVEGDLKYARDIKGAALKFITNFTKPSEITDLSYDSTNDTLNFTAPSSTNAIDFYDVYVNGCFHSEITGSGATITGLLAGDKVEVYTCDIYFNRSKSNQITI